MNDHIQNFLDGIGSIIDLRPGYNNVRETIYHEISQGKHTYFVDDWNALGNDAKRALNGKEKTYFVEE